MECTTPPIAQSIVDPVNLGDQESVAIIGSQCTDILFSNLHHNSCEKILSLRNALVNYRKANKEVSLDKHKKLLLNLLKTVKTEQQGLLADSVALHIVENYDLQFDQLNLHNTCKEFENHSLLSHIIKMVFLAYAVHVTQNNHDDSGDHMDLQLASGCSTQELAEWGYFNKDRKPIHGDTLDLHNYKIRYVDAQLDLSNPTHPEDIITVLLLNNNVLETISPKLTQFDQLTTLNLAHNRIKVIPDEIKELTQLEQLNLAHNRIEQIPLVVAQLRNLRSLDLNNNKVIALPQGLLLNLPRALAISLKGNLLDPSKKEQYEKFGFMI